MRIEWTTARTHARQIWRHMDGALGVTLVLLAVCGLGWSAKAWQDWAEIERIDARVSSVQASMAQLCTERVADLGRAYNDRQQQGERLIAEQTSRISEQSARIADQSAQIAELRRQLATVDRTTAEISKRQQINAARNAVVAKEAARTAATQAAQETVQQTNEQARRMINREVKK